VLAGAAELSGSRYQGTEVLIDDTGRWRMEIQKEVDFRAWTGTIGSQLCMQSCSLENSVYPENCGCKSQERPVAGGSL